MGIIGVEEGSGGRRAAALLLANRETAAATQQFLEKEYIPPPVAGFAVMQREAAILTHRRTKITHLGTMDVTTCLGVFLFHPSSQTVAVCHCDGVEAGESLRDLVEAVAGGDTESEVILDLVGAYGREEDSVRVVTAALEALASQPIPCRPRVVCILGVNQKRPDREGDIPRPKCTGAALDLSTGELLPARWPPHKAGPARALRATRYWSPLERLVNVWNAAEDVLQVDPIPYLPVPARELRALLSLTDEEMLPRVSTSPKVEPPHFCDEMRASLRFLLEHPDARETFRNGPKKFFPQVVEEELVWEEVES